MTLEELLARRWAAHGLGAGAPGPVARTVARLGAVQAQDEPAAFLGVALRLPGSGVAAVEAALAAGDLVRAHVLRPTWHLVAGTDLRWLTALTGGGISRSLAPSFRQAGVGASEVDRAVGIVEERLARGPVSKGDCLPDWAAAGLPTGSPTSTHYLLEAEARGLLCQTGRAGRGIVFDAVDRVLPPGPSLPRDEALARLATAYLRGHGPASDRDFAWWGGLNLTDARRGLGASGAVPAEGPGDLGKLWLRPPAETDGGAEAGGPGPAEWAWLPAFDEFVLGYADRTPVVPRPVQPRVFTSNGIFRPVVLRRGRAVGTWKATGAPDRPEVAVDWLGDPPPGAGEALEAWADRLGNLRRRS